MFGKQREIPDPKGTIRTMFKQPGDKHETPAVPIRIMVPPELRDRLKREVRLQGYNGMADFFRVQIRNFLGVSA